MTQSYFITIPYTTHVVVEVERASDIDEETLIRSITRDDLEASEEVGDAWSSLKDAWRNSHADDLWIEDEFGDTPFNDYEVDS